VALVSGLQQSCYSEAEYQRRMLEELYRQQAYGQQVQGIAGQYIDPPKSDPERDNPVLLLLP
jgi:hypothetical protein